MLGPFQGKPACVRIPVGRGVCGAAVARGETLVVPDVHAFPGHIACDHASQSELVVPLRRDDRITGVLDLDSPRLSRFVAELASRSVLGVTRWRRGALSHLGGGRNNTV